MSLSLEKERKRLVRYEEWHKAQRMNYPELLQQRKLVTALEQLEQARTLIHNMVWNSAHEGETVDMGKAYLAALELEALKQQQEVG